MLKLLTFGCWYLKAVLFQVIQCHYGFVDDTVMSDLILDVVSAHCSCWNQFIVRWVKKEVKLPSPFQVPHFQAESETEREKCGNNKKVSAETWIPASCQVLQPVCLKTSLLQTFRWKTFNLFVPVLCQRKGIFGVGVFYQMVCFLYICLRNICLCLGEKKWREIPVEFAEFLENEFESGLCVLLTSSLSAYVLYRCFISGMHA